MTAIKIKANKGITDHFTEDDTTGIYRIGRQIIIDKPVEKVAFFNTPEVSINTDFTQRADILTFQLLTSSFSGVKKAFGNLKISVKSIIVEAITACQKIGKV